MEDERAKAAAAAAEQETRARAVAGAPTFDALYGVLEGFGNVRGGHREYSAQELINRIQTLRVGRSDMSSITNTYGIRDKVQELVHREQRHGQE